MLIRSKDLAAIQNGGIDTAFRRWTRPTVKAGGSLTTSAGVIAIAAVDAIAPSEITDEDARRAGFASAAAVRETLDTGRPGQVYRIRLRPGGDDPRIALRDSMADLDSAMEALARLDRRTAWTTAVLMLIEAHPATPAQVLAAQLGMEKLKFKARVRQLKAMGLTESLEVGYRLSARGRAVLARRRAPTASA
jgi:hypothetical protein